MSRHAACTLPTSKLEKRIQVSIPSSKVSIPSSKVSIPVSINTATGGIVVQVRKIQATVTDLQQEVAEETVARKDLQVCVEKLIAENAEAKTKQCNLIQHPTPIFIRMLPCKPLIGLDELLAFIEDEIRWLQLTEYVKMLGGRDFNDSIKITLNALMVRSLQKQVSWTGRGTKKPSFQTKYKGIVDSIHFAMKDRYKDYTMAKRNENEESITKCCKLV